MYEQFIFPIQLQNNYLLTIFPIKPPDNYFVVNDFCQGMALIPCSEVFYRSGLAYQYKKEPFSFWDIKEVESSNS